MSEANRSFKKKIVKRASGSMFYLWGRRLVLLGLIGLIAWVSLVQLRGLILHQLANYQEVEVGIVEQELLVERALLVRDETVLFAPNSGTLLYLVPEGQKVAEGEMVARIQSSYGISQGIKATRAGIVCYHTDGLENVLTPALADTLILSKLEIPPSSLRESAQGAQVERGQPILKLVNNLEPFLIRMEFDVEYLNDFPVLGSKLQFRLEGQEYQARLTKLETQGVIARGLLALDREELLHGRELNLSLIMKKARGLKIPNEALVYMDETQGVYKVFTRDYRWVPVTLVLQDQEYSIVEGLSRGDRIITNPHLLQD